MRICAVITFRIKLKDNLKYQQVIALQLKYKYESVCKTHTTWERTNQICLERTQNLDQAFIKASEMTIQTNQLMM